MKSVFAVDVMPAVGGQQVGHQQPAMAPGGLAVGGAGGTIEVLSCYGTRLMSTRVSEDLLI